MPKKISLKQFLMRTGKFSKAFEAEKAVSGGKVLVDNKIIRNKNYFFDQKKSIVKYEGEKLKRAPKLYFLMNKPAGYVCQKSPGEKSIYDIIKKSEIESKLSSSLFAVGRLDKDTEGLIVITNDGMLANKIMKPENKIAKKYYVILESAIDTKKIKMLEKGVVIGVDNEPYKTKPGKVEILGPKQLFLSISEGKKRQIKKMLEAIGNKAVYLKRVSIGSLQLGNLKPGEMRKISREEILRKLFC